MLQKDILIKCKELALSFFLIGGFFISDPASQLIYLFYCTYRIQTLVRIAQIGISFITVILFAYKYFIKKEKIRLGYLPLYLLIYVGYLISCIVNAGNDYLPRWWDALSTCAIPLILFAIMFSEEESARKNIKILSACYIALSVINLMLYFFPQLYIGEAKEWREAFFLGSKNRAGWPLMIGAFINLLNDSINNRKVETIVYFLLLFVNLYIMASVTIILGFVIIVLGYTLPVIKKGFQKIDFIVLISVTGLFFVFLMWFLLPITEGVPVKFLLGLIGKDPKLSDRYQLWTVGLDIVLLKPFFGYGLQEATGFIPHTNAYGTTYHHAHNEILQCWYEGGFLTLILVMAGMVYMAYFLRNCQNKIFDGICKMMLFSFLVMLQGDIIPYYPWYLVAVIANVSMLVSSQCFANKTKAN